MSAKGKSLRRKTDPDKPRRRKVFDWVTHNEVGYHVVGAAPSRIEPGQSWKRRKFKPDYAYLTWGRAE